MPYIDKSTSDNYGTPISIIKKYCNVSSLDEIWDCSPYPKPEWDGLTIDWPLNKIIWANVPYSQLKKWSVKIKFEAQRGRRIVCICPSRTSTNYFHENLSCFDYIVFPKRIAFISYDRPEITGKCPMSLMICYYNLKPTFLNEIICSKSS